MNVLVTNIGRKTYFVEFLIKLKNKFNKSFKIHLTDCSRNTASFYNGNNINCHLTPKVINNGTKYFKELLKIVIKNKINVIIPLTDFDLKILSRKKNILKKFSCHAIVSDIGVINSCFDKRKINVICKKIGLNYPKTWSNIENFKGRFPIIKKHIFGCASSGLKIIKNKFQLKEFSSKSDILQKMIIGQEFHLDILNNLDGEYVSHCSKKKLKMRSGETDKAKIVINSRFKLIAIKLSKILKHVGNLDCDLIIGPNNKIYILDLNPRFGGGYPFTHLSGLNYLEAVIKMVLKYPYKLPKFPKSITGFKGVDLTWRI